MRIQFLFPTQPNKLRAFISNHPLMAYIILAYAISWISWWLLWLDKSGATNGLSTLAAAGPSLAAVTISAIQKPNASKTLTQKRWVLFFLMLVVISMILFLRRFWLRMALVAIPGRPVPETIYPSLVAFLIDSLGASSVAFVISSIYTSREGVRDLLHSLNLQQAKVGWYWFVIAVGSYPAVVLVGNALALVSGANIPAPSVTGLWYWVGLDAVLMFFYTLLCGGGFEEPGWRGFTLPALQISFNPLISTLLLGLIWAFWHWPLFWFGYYGGGVFQVLFYSLGITQMAIWLTVLYNRTRGSLPVVMLSHAAFNITSMYLPVMPPASLLWLLICIGLGVWMWRKPLAFQSAEYAAFQESFERIGIAIDE